MRAVGDASQPGNPFVTELPTRAQVAVVDDHVLVGRLVVQLLERAGYTAATAYAQTADATWNCVSRIGPELILLDFDLGPMQSSIDILQRAAAAGIVVVGFTGSDDVLEHAAFLEAGAAVVISKSCGPADLIAVVELALAGQELMSPADRHAALARLRRQREAANRRLTLFEMLTDREAETLLMLADGYGASEIATAWEVALPTVRSHIRAVLAKLGVTSQLQAAALARNSDWYAIIRGTASSILTMSRGMETGTIARRSGSTG